MSCTLGCDIATARRNVCVDTINYESVTFQRTAIQSARRVSDSHLTTVWGLPCSRGVRSSLAKYWENKDQRGSLRPKITRWQGEPSEADELLKVMALETDSDRHIWTSHEPVS